MEYSVLLAIVIVSTIFILIPMLVEWAMYNKQNSETAKVSFLNFTYNRLEDFLLDIKKNWRDNHASKS